MPVVDQLRLKKEWYNNDVSATAANHQLPLIEANSKGVDI